MFTAYLPKTKFLHANYNKFKSKMIECCLYGMMEKDRKEKC